MQEEITQKVVTLSVKMSKGTTRLTEAALKKAFQAFLEARKNPQIKHGKQTMRQLARQNTGISNIEITKENIKGFESTAKKYGLDYSLKKIPGEQPQYLVFFKGRDLDVMTSAFREFSAKKLNKDKKPSIRKSLEAAKVKAKTLNASREQTKKLDRGRDR
mgnify:FL=1